MMFNDINMNSELIEQENINESKQWFRNIFLSVIIHLSLLVLILFLFNYNQKNALMNPRFLYIETQQYKSNFKPMTGEEIQGNQKSFIEKDETAAKFINLSELEADTTNMDQLYKESSLNLSIKYPRGWTFIDQNKNKKLDGVTFWAIDGSYKPPSYIHLEVIEKYLFNEKRYKNKIKLTDCVAYYNEPEELAGQVMQVFYLRTDSEEDYLIKFIVGGMEQYNSFQPRLLAILKSFSFGNSIF